MSRRLSETQKRLWAQASELLGKIDPRAPVAELPASFTDVAEVPTDTGVGEFYTPEASVSVGEVVKNPQLRTSADGIASLDVPARTSADGIASLDVPARTSADGIASLDVPARTSADSIASLDIPAPTSADGIASLDVPAPTSADGIASLDVPALTSAAGIASLDTPATPQESGDAVSQIPDSLSAYITLGAELPEPKSKASAKKKKAAAAETAPEIATAEVQLAAPTDEPVLEAVPVPVLSKEERIAAARAAFTLDSVADEYAVSFFKRIVWTGGGGGNAPAVLAAPVQAPALELSIVGSRTFFSTCIPWAGRGQLPAAPGESTGGAAPLRSLLAAATESALHAARRMARGPGARNAARNGSAAAFFQNLAWQRQQTEIAA